MVRLVIEELKIIKNACGSQEENLGVTLAKAQLALKDFLEMWDGLELEERREVLRLLIEELKVSPTHMQLKLLFLEPVTISLKKKSAINS